MRYTNLCLAIKLILMPHASVIFLGKSRKSYKEIGARTLSQARSVNGGQQINMFNRQMGIKSTRIEEDICHAAELQLATCNTLMCQQQDSSATTFYASAAADVQPDVSLDVSLDVSPMSSFPKYSPRSICVL